MRAIPGRRFDWVEQGVARPAPRGHRGLRRRRPRALAASSSPPTRSRGWLDGHAVGLARPRQRCASARRRRRVRRAHARGRAAARARRARRAPTATTAASHVLPFTPGGRRRAARGGRARGWSKPALGCATRLQVGVEPAARRARRSSTRSTSRGSGSSCCGTPTPPRRSSRCPAPTRAAARCRSTRGCSSRSRRFLRTHDVAVSPARGRRSRGCAPSTTRRSRPIRRSRSRAAEPIEAIAARLGGELAPFQWAGVRYALDARRTFLADEQGLGKTVQALAALEADDAFPAVVVCPASLKLNWEREARALAAAPHARGRQRPRRRPRREADLVIVNYEIVAGAPRGARRGAARRRSSSTSRTTARTRGPSARRRCAGSRRRCPTARCASRSPARR